MFADTNDVVCTLHRDPYPMRSAGSPEKGPPDSSLGNLSHTPTQFIYTKTIRILGLGDPHNINPNNKDTRVRGPHNINQNNKDTRVRGPP